MEDFSTVITTFPKDFLQDKKWIVQKDQFSELSLYAIDNIENLRCVEDRVQIKGKYLFSRVEKDYKDGKYKWTALEEEENKDYEQIFPLSTKGEPYYSTIIASNFTVKSDNGTILIEGLDAITKFELANVGEDNTIYSVAGEQICLTRHFFYNKNCLADISPLSYEIRAIIEDENKAHRRNENRINEIIGMARKGVTNLRIIIKSFFGQDYDKTFKLKIFNKKDISNPFSPTEVNKYFTVKYKKNEEDFLFSNSKNIVVYPAIETKFKSNGLAILDNTLRAEVVEILNGDYNLMLEYPIEDKKADYLRENNIIKVLTPNRLQCFRIYRTVDTLDTVTVYAKHLFFDLANNFIKDIC